MRHVQDDFCEFEGSSGAGEGGDLKQSSEFLEDAFVRRCVSDGGSDVELLLDGVDGVGRVQELEFSLEHIESGDGEKGIVDEVVVVWIFFAEDEKNEAIDVVMVVVLLGFFAQKNRLLLLGEGDGGAKLDKFVEAIEGGDVFVFSERSCCRSCLGRRRVRDFHERWEHRAESREHTGIERSEICNHASELWITRRKVSEHRDKLGHSVV